MAQVRCPFCHKYIDESVYSAHTARHLKTRPDGQHTDYVTLPPDERDENDLTDVPQAYVHKKCGVGTRMPEDIIRSYLKNPYLYMANETYCCGCRKHVPLRQCTWVETGEDLQTYTDRLRAAKPEMKPAWLKGMDGLRDFTDNLRTSRNRGCLTIFATLGGLSGIVVYAICAF